jgi:ferredoxin
LIILQDYLVTSLMGKFCLERRNSMKTQKKKEMTQKEKVYEELRQSYGVVRSPAMMKLLEFFFPTLEEAEICKHLEDLYTGGKAKTIAELAEETGKDIEKVREVVEGIGAKVIIKWRERAGTPGVLEYYNTGSRGLKNAWGHIGKIDAEGQTFIKLINDVLDTQGARIPKFKPRTLMIDETVNAETKILPYEMASEIIKWKAKAGVPIALIWCNCRVYRQKCDRSRDNCIVFGQMADFYVPVSKTTKGARPNRLVTGEEALESLQESFRQGMVAQVMINQPSENRDVESTFKAISGICMCCSCCCEQLSRYVEFGNVGKLPEFLPKCDQEKCTSCEACVKICPVNARWRHWPLKPDLSDNYIYLEAEKCIGCGLCAYACKPRALSMVRTTEQTPVRT